MQPWERYLQEYKNIKNRTESTITPSQAQRGFADLLKIIGTPAKACVARGKTSGRKVGEAQVKRELMQIIFKAKKVRNQRNLLLRILNLPPIFQNPKE